MKTRIKDAFAVWITGLPASGKSTLAAALRSLLDERGIDAAVLESDELRNVLSPRPRYDEQARERFYGQLVYIGALLVSHGVPVIIDATANLRKYRDLARSRLPRFVEVYVDTALPVCMSRDPKGIYRAARPDPENFVPGVKAPYEPPEQPELVVHGDKEAPVQAAARVVQVLVEKGYL